MPCKHLRTLQKQFFICKIDLGSSKANKNFLAIVLFLRMLQSKRILNRQTDKFTACGLRKFLELDHHETHLLIIKKYYKCRSILRKNIGEQTLKIHT